jgi:tetratricopeptide (TPR) repeat protein
VIVRTELMDVATGSQLWGGQYSRKAADVFVLQDELSNEISDRLRLRLTAEEKQLLTKRNTTNAAAYQLYLRGRYYWNKRSPDGILRAIEYFNGAIDADPGYALAYSGLADTYNQMSFFNMVPPNEAMPKAKAAAARALQIDGRLADPHIALAYASFTYDWDWPAATRHFDEALALDRDAVVNHSYYPFYLTVAGRSAEAIDVARRAFERDPISAAGSHTLTVQLLLGRRVDEAIAQCRRTIALDPNLAIAHELLSNLYATKALFRDALTEVEKAAALNRGEALSVAYVGYVRAHLADRAGARQILARLAEMSKARYTPALAFAIVSVGLGEHEQALTWLEKAYDERFNRLAYLAREPVWDPLRQDPRFQDLVRRMNLPR